MRDPVVRKRVQKWEAGVGVFCFIVGIIAPLLGLSILSIEWLAGIPSSSRLHAIGAALLIIGIPLILFAGFCLDWSEGRPRKDAHHGPDQNSSY